MTNGGVKIKKQSHSQKKNNGLAKAKFADVLAIVPAHNEESGIRATIESLLSQTYRGRIDIVVISDNSTDRTVEIVKAFAVRNSRVGLIETVGNKYKKSGALNAAYEKLGEKLDKYGFVLAMDADTQLAPTVVSEAMAEFKLDPRLGAVCSRAGLIRQKTETFLQKLIFHVQHTEYAEFDRSRIAQDRAIKVAHGMCTVYNTEAIREVMGMRLAQGKPDCLPYDVHNITEDYELTVCIKELGYHTAVGLGMYAWTDVPLSLKELWLQRVRWLRGDLDTLWQHGWNPATRKDIVNSGFFWVMVTLQLILLRYAFLDIIAGNFHLSPMVVGVMALMYVDCVYTLRYVQDISIWDYAVRLTFLPQLLYAWFTIAQQIYAYYLFLFKPDQEW